MYNFVMIFQDTNIPPNKVTVQIKNDTMAHAITEGTTVLGLDTKGNPHVFVKALTVQAIPEIEEDE